MMFRVFFLGATLLCLSACLAGDVAFKMSGQLVDDNGEPYSACYVEGKQKDEVVYRSDVSGIFATTVVFGAVSSAPLQLYFSCDGTEDVFMYKLERIPRPFGEVLDLGSVELMKSTKE